MFFLFSSMRHDILKIILEYLELIRRVVVVCYGLLQRRFPLVKSFISISLVLVIPRISDQRGWCKAFSLLIWESTFKDMNSVRLLLIVEVNIRISLKPRV